MQRLLSLNISQTNFYWNFNSLVAFQFMNAITLESIKNGKTPHLEYSVNN